jgi:hypothetical protein
VISPLAHRIFRLGHVIPMRGLRRGIVTAIHSSWLDFVTYPSLLPDCKCCKNHLLGFSSELYSD